MTPVVSKPYMIQPKATGNNENICIVPYKVCACLLHSKQVFVSGNNNKKAWRTNPCSSALKGSSKTLSCRMNNVRAHANTLIAHP